MSDHRFEGAVPVAADACRHCGQPRDAHEVCRCESHVKGGALCEDNATARVFWPGRSLDMCALHALHAANIAEAMGFTLAVQSLSPVAPQ